MSVQPEPFYTATRLALRLALRKKGYGFASINNAVSAATENDNELIDGAVADTGTAAAIAKVTTTTTTSGNASATGGGFLALVQEFFAFLQSPTGQSIIAALLPVLIGLL